MAPGRYEAVLLNEKRMNDIISSVLANLHKAAWKKKRNHIWSPYKFDSLKSIWGDNTGLETNKINSKASNNEASSTTVEGNNENIRANAAERRGNFCEKDTEELLDGNKVLDEKSGEDVLEKCQDMDDSLEGYGFEIYSQSHCKSKTPSDQTPLKSRPELINDRQNQLELSNNVFRRSVQYGVPDKLSFSKQKSILNDSKVGISIMMCKKFDDSGTRHADNDLVHHFPQNTLTSSKTSCPSKDSTSSDDETTSNLSPISKTRRSQKLSKPIKTAFDEQNTLRLKRNREDSDSSTGSIKPLQKKTPLKTVNRNSKDGEDNIFKALLSLKIVEDDHFHEITINASEFDRVRKKYPLLRDVLPDTDSLEKEIPYCAEAVKIIIVYLFHPPFDFNAMPDGRISIEILAATKAWAIQRFHDNFQQHFLKKMTQSNCRTIHSLARHFDLHEICNACKTFLPANESFNDRRSYKSRRCLVAVARYVEPLEFCIPLGTAEQLLNDNFDRDIRNTVIFEAITKDFTVAGFQIALDASEGTTTETSAALDIFYSIKLTDSLTDPQEIQVSRPLRPNIAVYFKRKVPVKKRDKLQISVETTIKPYLCFETYENFIKTSDDAEFCLTVESTYRVKNSGGKRFIIGKLLYNPSDEVQ